MTSTKNFIKDNQTASSKPQQNISNSNNNQQHKQKSYQQHHSQANNNERSISRDKHQALKPEQVQSHPHRTNNDARNHPSQKPAQNKPPQPMHKITPNNNASQQQQHSQRKQQPQNQQRQQQPQQHKQQPQQHQQRQQPHKKDHHSLQHKKTQIKSPVVNIEAYRNKVKGLGGSGLTPLELEQIHTMLQNDTLGISTREEILSLIAEEGNAISLPAIYKMLANKSVKLREKALHILYFAFQDRNSIPSILERLQDPNEHTEVRRKALSVLKLFRSEDTIPPILDFISALHKKTPATPHEEMVTRQEIEDALDALAILLTLTENAHAFSLARGKGRKELFARLIEACDTQYKVNLSHMESALIIS